MNICIIAGARPNFMKIAPIIEALKRHNQKGRKVIQYKLIHTGQHYDEAMSRLFFRELDIPAPDANLEVGSASHAVQTAEIMKKYEEICLRERPTHTMVVGDVNSTVACALVSAKLGIEVVHVEAGLRSFDRSMPEEVNRVLTDAISDILLTSEKSARKNLIREGVSKSKIFFVGNVMIDTLISHRDKAMKSLILSSLGLTMGEITKPYGVLTLHRPSNVDEIDSFREIIEAVQEIAASRPIIFPAHPRTNLRIREFGLEGYFKNISEVNVVEGNEGIFLINPLGYLDFLKLTSNAEIVLCDSGGIQEETTILGVPCVTLRENTERPVTVTNGTNIIAGTKKEAIINAVKKQLFAFSQLERNDAWKAIKRTRPPLWDGKAAERIVSILSEIA